MWQFQQMKSVLDYREHSFLHNPLTPPSLASAAVRVQVASNASEAAALRSTGVHAIFNGASDMQVPSVVRVREGCVGMRR
jgi:hypothetical protein